MRWIADGDLGEDLEGVDAREAPSGRIRNKDAAHAAALLVPFPHDDLLPLL